MNFAGGLASTPVSPRGFIVAGGRSSRMGRDKAELPFEDGTLLEQAIRRVRAITTDVRILCGPTLRYESFGVPVVEDAVCGAGPLGGLYSALQSASCDGCERTFWLAVDLPLVPSAFLAGMVASLDHADVAMARTERGIEPLCAAFRTEPALACVRRALLAGQLKLTRALDGLTRRTLEADIAVFTNVNTREDYEGLHRIPGS